MTVWLWDAGNARGVSDDESRARQAASACLRDGRAGTARVERALLVIGGSWLTSGYRRTGDGWLALPRRDGRVLWAPLARAAELAAS